MTHNDHLCQGLYSSEMLISETLPITTPSQSALIHSPFFRNVYTRAQPSDLSSGEKKLEEDNLLEEIPLTSQDAQDIASVFHDTCSNNLGRYVLSEYMLELKLQILIPGAGK